MTPFLDEIRLLAASMLAWPIGAAPNRPRRMRRRGEVGLEALQVALFAALLSGLAFAVYVAVARATNSTTTKIQTP
jgi:hypothetical protein